MIYSVSDIYTKMERNFVQQLFDTFAAEPMRGLRNHLPTLMIPERY